MRLDNETLMDPRVGSELRSFVAVKYDADQPVGKAISHRYRVGGFPGFVVIEGNGDILADFAGYRSADELISKLRSILVDQRGRARG